MKKILLISILILTITANNSFAQIIFQRSFGNGCGPFSGNVRGQCHQTNDGGYIFTDKVNCGISTGNELYLGKTNSYGELVWSRTFAKTNSILTPYSVQQTNDGGFVIVGGDFQDVFLIKTDSTGKLQWSKIYEGTNLQYGYSVEQTTDNGYIITGAYYSFLIKTDSIGDIIWTKKFNVSHGYVVHQTYDGGYIIGGASLSGDGDMSLIKTNSNGNTIWAKSYVGVGYDECRSLQQTSDSGYILCGPNLNLVKIDSIGDVTWSKKFSNMASSSSNSVCQTNGGGYLISGRTTTFDTDGDGLLIKTNANGDLVWAKTYGGGVKELFSYAEQTNDLGFIISGYSDFIGGSVYGGSIYIVKTDSLGNSSCFENSPPYTETTPSIIATNFIPVITTTGGNAIANPFTSGNGNSFGSCVICSNDTSIISVPPVENYSYYVTGNDVQFVNSGQYSKGILWDFGDGSTSILNNPIHYFEKAGTFNVCLSNCNGPGSLDPLIVCKNISINGIQNISPKEIAPVGTYIFEMTGTGLGNVINMLLKKNGQTSVTADSIIIMSNSRLRAIFNINSALALGNWTPHIQFSNLTVFDLVDGLKVSPYEEPKLSIKLSGSPLLRPGFNQIYSVTITNEGNVNAYFPIVMIGGLPAGTVFEILNDSIIGGNDIITLDTLDINYDSIATTSLVDSVALRSFYMYQPYKIPARGSTTLNIIFHVPTNTPLGTIYSITTKVIKPMYTSASPVAQQRMRGFWSDCAFSVLDLAATATLDFASLGAWQSCAQGLYSYGSSFINTLKGAAEFVELDISNTSSTLDIASNNLSMTSDFIQTSFGLVASMRGCVEGAAGLIPQAKIAKMLLKIYQGVGYASQINSIYQNCWPPDELEPPNEVEDEDNLQITTVASIDPNIKIGPGSNSISHYTNKNGELIYTIQFENDTSASLAAQTIRILDSLDTTKFDLNTLEFINVTLGSKSVSISNVNSFIKQLNFSSELGVNARIVGQIDSLTGIVSVTAFTIDTSTNQISSDPFVGILPPDTLAPMGQGSVSFRIKLLPGVGNGDTIKNSASIIFDYNSPIATPIWQNIIDTLKPQSQLTILNNITTNDSILISWYGLDNLSGVESYDVYASFDSLNYYRLLNFTKDTSFYYHNNTLSSVVYFYSVARDSAGNIENAPANYDAKILFTLSLPLTLKNFFVSEYNCTALLSWTTSQESNASHIDILKKSNITSAFQKIATVQSAGQSSQEKMYSYIDKDVKENNTYEYQLQFVDIDGRISKSDSKIITLNCSSSNSSIHVFPNPAKSELNVLYVTESNNSEIEIAIYDLTGRNILSKIQSLNNGGNLITLDVSKLSNGIYFLYYKDIDSMESGSVKFEKK